MDKDERPVVFVFAGKAHPADRAGTATDAGSCTGSATCRSSSGRLLLVEGYDMGLGRLLTSGVDVWLNTPVYPMEASGTSGMKAAINGTVNVSVLDGWWAEGLRWRQRLGNSTVDVRSTIRASGIVTIRARCTKYCRMRSFRSTTRGTSASAIRRAGSASASAPCPRFFRTST